MGVGRSRAVAACDAIPEDGTNQLRTAQLAKFARSAADYESSAQAYGTFLRVQKNPQAYRAHFGIGWSLENRKKFDEAALPYRR